MLKGAKHNNKSITILEETMLDVFSILESGKAFPRMSQNPETTKGKTNKELHKNKKSLLKKKIPIVSRVITSAKKTGKKKNTISNNSQRVTFPNLGRILTDQ